MQRSADQLLDDALGIWLAGVDAVRPERLILQYVDVQGQTLRIGNEHFDLERIGRIAVVGAGKAGTGMVLALEKALGQSVLRDKQVNGWVNVPADCLAETAAIHLHAARPAGVNEPTAEGVAGTGRILELVGSLGPSDLCLVLISGGGSALLPAPMVGLSLKNKVAMTQLLSAAGATIGQLNAVRRELSSVKGGGLARACRAGKMVSLILSDVPGDDLETIASGPTVETPSDPQRAINILRELDLDKHPAGCEVIDVLQKQPRQPTSQDESCRLSAVGYRPEDTIGGSSHADSRQVGGLEVENPSRRLVVEKADSHAARLTNIIIGNNATAVDAAGVEAERRGYSHAMISATQPEGTAEGAAAAAEQRLKDAKDEGRNKVCAIDTTPVGWDEFAVQIQKSEKLYNYLRDGALSHVFVYKILEFDRERRRAELPPDSGKRQSLDLHAASWRARWGYHLARNVRDNKALGEPQRRLEVMKFLNGLLGLDTEMHRLAGATASPRTAVSIALYRNRKPTERS